MSCCVYDSEDCYLFRDVPLLPPRLLHPLPSHQLFSARNRPQSRFRPGRTSSGSPPPQPPPWSSPTGTTPAGPLKVKKCSGLKLLKNQPAHWSLKTSTSREIVLELIFCNTETESLGLFACRIQLVKRPIKGCCKLEILDTDCGRPWTQYWRAAQLVIPVW